MNAVPADRPGLDDRGAATDVVRMLIAASGNRRSRSVGGAWKTVPGGVPTTSGEPVPIAGTVVAAHDSWATDDLNVLSAGRSVVTINVGLSASMASFLLCGGTKGSRLALPNSRVMIHQPMGGAQGQAEDIKVEDAQGCTMKPNERQELLSKREAQLARRSELATRNAGRAERRKHVANQHAQPHQTLRDDSQPRRFT